MWISEKEYDDLVLKAKTAEDNPKIKELEERVDDLVKEKETQANDHTREVENLKADHKVLVERKDSEIETKIAKKTKELTETLAKVTMEKNNAEKEAEILRTAFQNLGFDVKDMKEILNKLVDGIVSKNQIQLINGNGK